MKINLQNIRLGQAEETYFKVEVDWRCEQEYGHDTYIFKDRQRAEEKFRNLVADEKNPDNSWVGQALEKGLSNYEMFETEETFSMTNDFVDKSVEISISERLYD